MGSVSINIMCHPRKKIIAPALAIALCMVYLLTIPCRAALFIGGAGFSVELIHRDTPKSPYYDPAETPIQRIRRAFHRSISRAHRLAGPGTSPVSEIISSDGEYLMNISIGTPKVNVLAISDTGSDLIWTQCKPCQDCFDQTAPLFDPTKSSTYRDVSCLTRKCSLLSQTTCDSVQEEICQYSYSYGDQSYTNGNVALETITLDSTSGTPISFPQILFGCGHNNGGTFDSHMTGIVGLGGGPVSLVSQLGQATGGTFSYCLVPHFSDQDHKSSRLNFGSTASTALSGPGIVSTPLLSKDSNTFYYLTLEAVSVGKTRINFEGQPPSASPSENGGNIIIDSGTTLTLLPKDFYSQLEQALAKLIKLERVHDDEFPGLCYRSTTNIVAPPVTVHFKGADVKLGSDNIFVRTSENTVCFSFSPTEVGVSIYGNLAQMNFLIGYDKQRKVVSFKPADCSKL